jgi:hypothetical protein
MILLAYLYLNLFNLIFMSSNGLFNIFFYVTLKYELVISITVSNTFYEYSHLTLKII